MKITYRYEFYMLICVTEGNDLHDMVKHSFDLTKPKRKVKK